MNSNTLISLGFLGGIAVFGAGVYWYFEKNSRTSESGSSGKIIFL